MTIFLWILFGLLAVFIFIHIFIRKVYDVKPVPHKETPDKFDLSYEEVHFPTVNDKSLYGWWIPAANDPESAPTLILVHGLYRNLGRMLRYIQHLHPLGYNLMAFDSRHHGSSDRDGHASLYKFGQDIQAAVKDVQTRNIDSSRIGVIGLSLGGAGAVYAASLEPMIKAVATVGAPAHPVDVMTRRFKQDHMPKPVIWYALKQIESIIGVTFDSFAPENCIAKARASFFIIHGDEDQVVLPSQGEKLCKAARAGQSQCWSIPEFAHSNCHHHPEFWNRLHAFFQEKLASPVAEPS